jgi:hypothetical protein
MTNGSDAKRIARIVKNIESAQSALMDTRLDGNRVADHIACVLDRQGFAVCRNVNHRIR